MSVMQQITDIKNDSPTLVKGKVSSVWGIKNILAMTDDDEEEDDEVMANNGPCADMSKKVFKIKLTCATKPGAKKNSPDTIPVYFYDTWAEVMSNILKIGDIVTISGSGGKFIHHNPGFFNVNFDHVYVLCFSDRPDADAFIETEHKKGDEIFKRKWDAEKILAGTAYEQEKENKSEKKGTIPKAKKRKQTDTEYKYLTLEDIRSGIKKGSMDSVNVYAMVTSYQQVKATSGTNKFMMSYNIVDPSLNDLTVPVALNMFANSRESFPVITQCGDMIRLHRVKAQEFNGALQLVGWTDSKRSTVVVARRQADPFTGLPVVESEPLVSSSSSSPSAGAGAGTTGLSLGRDGDAADDDDESSLQGDPSRTKLSKNSAKALKHPGLSRHEWEITSKLGGMTWSDGDAERFRVLYAWSSSVLAHTPFLESTAARKCSLFDIVNQATIFQQSLAENRGLSEAVARQTLLTRPACDIVVMTVAVDNTEGYKGLWVWDGSTPNQFEISETLKGPGGNIPRNFRLAMRALTSNLFASQIYRDVDMPVYHKDNWLDYWSAMVAQSHDHQAQLPDICPIEADPLTRPALRARVRNNGLPALPFVGEVPMGTLPTGYPVLLRVRTKELENVIQSLTMGSWIRIRNMALEPVAYMHKDTHICPILSTYADPKDITNKYIMNMHKELAIAPLAMAVSPSLKRNGNGNGNGASSASTSIPPPSRPPGRRLTSITGAPLTNLVVCLAGPVPAKYCCAVKVLDFAPKRNIVQLVNGIPTFMLSIRVQDDTTITDFILYAKDAETFFGNITAVDFNRFDHIRDRVLKALNKLVTEQIIVDVNVRGYKPATPAVSKDTLISPTLKAQMKWDKEHESKKFQVFNTTLPFQV